MARPRRWSDDQLRIAVQSSVSWNEVSEKIGRGRNGPGRRAACSHALRLGLDLSHLPPLTGVEPAVLHEPDPVDLTALADAVAGSRSWGEVVRKLGVSMSSRAYRRLRGAAEHACIDSTHFTGDPLAPIAAIAVPFSAPPNAAAHLRRSGVAIAAQWFLARGYMVSVPVDHVAYDLVVESDNGLRRVQVKTTVRRGRYVVGITRHEYGSTRHSNGYYWRNRPYRTDEVDHFFICGGDGSRYLVPVTAMQGQMSITLDRIAAYKLDGEG